MKDFRRLRSISSCFSVWALSMGSQSFADGTRPYVRNVSFVLTVNKDNLFQETMTEDIKILTQAAVQQFGQISLPINEHFNSVDILEAMTIKPDGRTEPVPKESVLVSTSPEASTLSMFEADVKVRTVVFSDVAVGDTVHFITRITQKASYLPGGFSLYWIVPPSENFGGYDISLDTPEQTVTHDAVRGFDERIDIGDGRRRHFWSLPPQSFRAEEPDSVSPLDRDPYVVISTYADDAAFGHAFLIGAEHASEPTPAIRALADKLTRGLTDRREIARAIFDYVSKNIRYMAIFLGSGGWVPHQAQSIIDNKYGDCKDHVTLMRALLAAKSIDADYVLINTSAVYKEIAVPAPILYNHAIVYLPEFDLYVDPTSPVSDFQSLPEGDADKSVLRVGKHGVMRSRTPPISMEANRLSIKADVVIGSDGTATGESTIEASGQTALELREAGLRASMQGAEAYVKQRLRSLNWHGTGTLELHDPTDHLEPYIVKTKFHLTNRFFGEGENRNAIPIGPLLAEPVSTRIIAFIRDDRTQDFVCKAGTYNVSIDVHFPDGRTLASTPKDVAVSASFLTYKATYLLADQVLHLERSFTSNVRGQSCSAGMAQALAPVASAAARDFGTRLDIVESAERRSNP